MRVTTRLRERQRLDCVGVRAVPMLLDICGWLPEGVLWHVLPWSGGDPASISRMVPVNVMRFEDFVEMHKAVSDITAREHSPPRAEDDPLKPQWIVGGPAWLETNLGRFLFLETGQPKKAHVVCMPLTRAETKLCASDVARKLYLLAIKRKGQTLSCCATDEKLITPQEAERLLFFLRGLRSGYHLRTASHHPSPLYKLLNEYLNRPEEQAPADVNAITSPLDYKIAHQIDETPLQPNPFKGYLLPELEVKGVTMVDELPKFQLFANEATEKTARAWATNSGSSVTHLEGELTPLRSRSLAATRAQGETALPKEIDERSSPDALRLPAKTRGPSVEATIDHESLYDTPRPTRKTLKNNSPVIPSDKHLPVIPSDKHLPVIPSDKHSPVIPSDKHLPVISTDQHLLIGDAARNGRRKRTAQRGPGQLSAIPESPDSEERAAPQRVNTKTMTVVLRELENAKQVAPGEKNLIPQDIESLLRNFEPQVIMRRGLPTTRDKERRQGIHHTDDEADALYKRLSELSEEAHSPPA